ncbi:MAG: hypothetical protein EB824_06630 [Thaumarchaeota archaeon S15]|nr:MAG: hypothetical protein EB824_06630 [Thaumarchaeota archaeon S15]
MRALGADPGAAAMRRDAAFVKRTLSDILSATPRERRLRLEGDADEAAAYRSGLAPLVAHELGAELVVLGEGEGGGPKAASARPFKPAILVE